MRRSSTHERGVLEVLVVQLEVKLSLEDLYLEDGDVFELLLEDLNSLIDAREMIMESSKRIDLLELCCPLVIEVVAIVQSRRQALQDW